MTEPFLALCVTDILPSDALAERISCLTRIRSECPFFSRVCVRNDSFDPDMFRAAAEAVADAGFGLVLESADIACLRAASEGRPDAIVCPTDASIVEKAAVISCESDNPVAIPGDDVQDIIDNAIPVDHMGVQAIILNPSMRNMKSALETCTGIWRLGFEHGIRVACKPVMVRTWSGEYAMSVASVAILEGAKMAVLDDLDLDGCRVLDALMDKSVHLNIVNEN